MDVDYCAVRFKRKLEIINFINQIQSSEEFKEFYDWFDLFYELEIVELVNDFEFELSNKPQISQNYIIENWIENYIFDRIQYGKHKVNRGLETLVMDHLGSGAFYNKVEKLRLKFKQYLLDHQQLKNAYLKLTKHIDIRCLVKYPANPENLFLTWFSIVNYFAKIARLNQNLDSDKHWKSPHFEEQIYNYLNDYEYLAKNNGYRLGHKTIDDMTLFNDEYRSEKYLSLHLAENCNVPVAHVLIEYLEFLKFDLNSRLLTKNASTEQKSYLDQLDKTIQTLYSQNKQNAPKGAGIDRLLCCTVYNLMVQRGQIDKNTDIYESIKMLLDYLAEILRRSQVGLDYDGSLSNKSHLKLVVYETEYFDEDELFMILGLYNSRDMPFLKIFRPSEESNNKRIQPTCFEQDDPKLERMVKVRVNRNIELFTIKATNLYQLIKDEKDKLFSFENLYVFE
ncbi:hypothetical protein ABJ384_00840 [Acinetobacter sp. A1-4-2]|uniref:Uncharacterized protein n=1 Tax=Acinetobacter sp. A1-4-2 TaxID=3156489 RepID=A0AAU7SY59_9GAMM